MAESVLSRYVFRFGGFDKRIYILSFGWLVTSAGFAMVIPFLSIYFHQELGMSMTEIGLFFGFTAVMRSVPQPLAGWLSDRIGRVPAMGWSQILRSLTFFGVAWAISANVGFWGIAAIISLNYVFGAVLHPAANAMVADLVSKEGRLPAYALLRIAGNLGWAVGPAMGGFIAHKSYGALFAVAGVMAVISGVYFLLALRDIPQTAPSEGTAFKIGHIFNLSKDRQLFRHCLISFLLFMAVAQLIAALSVYSVDYIGITKAQLGTLYAINGFMVVVLQFPISGLFRKYKLTNQLAIGAAIYAVGYFLVGLASGFEFLLYCMIIITIAEMIVSPPSVTLVANLSPPGMYGRYMGIFGFFQMSGWSLGPTVGGFLLDLLATNTILMWSVIAGFAAVSVFLFIRFGRSIPDDVNSGSARIG